VFGSAFQMPGPNNSAADTGGNIQVTPGNRLPGIPAHAVKLRAEWAPDKRWAFGLGMTWYGRQHVRGDENNQDRNGTLPAYSVANLVVRYAFERGWELTAKVDNLFDRRYDTFGLLGRNVFTGPGNALDAANSAPEQFRSPGMARALWISLRYTIPAGVRL
jgi:outer membrane receptor protein involved in Fe transport